MGTPLGYKIYWGTSVGDPNGGIHTNPIYNSPISVPPTAVSGKVSYALPSAFLNDSSVSGKTIYITIKAYDANGEGTKSKQVVLSTFGKNMTVGLQGVSLPINTGETSKNYKTVLEMYGGTVMFFLDATGRWSNVVSGGGSNGPFFTSSSGGFINMASMRKVVFRGTAWKV